MREKLILMLLVSAVLSACNDSGGSKSKLPERRPSAQISGVAFDGTVSNGKVTVFAFDQGEKGQPIGAGTTDATGQFNITVTSSDRPLLIELSGGSHTEEFSGQTIQLREGELLRAVVNYRSGQDVHMALTHYSNMAVGLARFMIGAGELVDAAIDAANDQVSSLVGLDITRTIPLNVTSPGNASVSLTEGLRYGFASAAISSWTAWVSERNGLEVHRFYNSINFTQTAYRDVEADGLLDGFGRGQEGNSVQLAFGSVPVDANLYRKQLATHLLAMAAAETNNSTLGIDDLLPVAQSIASSEHVLFGGEPTIPLDNTPPDITGTEPEGQWKAGRFTFAVNAKDFVGVKEIIFYLNDAVLGEALDPANPTIEINSRNYADGEQRIGVKAVDALGNVANREFRVNFNNSGPIANVTSKMITNQAVYLLDGSWKTSDGSMAGITVQGQEAVVNRDGTWSAEVRLVAGVNPIPVIVSDGLGNRSELQVLVSLDQVPPSVNVNYSDARFVLDNGTIYSDTLAFAKSGDYPLYLATDKLTLNGRPLSSGVLDSSGIPNVTYVVSDSAVEGVFTSAENLKVEIRYLRNGDILSDWRPAPRAATGEGVAYLVALAEEGLAPGWHYTTPDELHEVFLRVTDEAGNQQTSKFSFKADIRPSDLDLAGLVVTDLGEGVFEVPFSRRGELHNRQGVLVNRFAGIKNDTFYDYYFRLDDAARHQVTNSVEKAIRENRVRLRTHTEWRARKVYHYGANCVNEYDKPSGSQTGYDPNWYELTSLSSYEGGRYVTRNAPVESGPAIDVYTDSPVAAPPLPWRDRARFSEETDRQKQVINTSTGSFAFFWRTDIRFMVGGKPYTAYSRGEDVCTNGLLYFQERKRYDYLSEPGYPRNAVSTFTETAGFTTTRFKVIDDRGAEIVPVGGWYRIPAGRSFVIEKYVSTPVMELHDDTEVGYLPSFRSYSVKQYDKSLSWNISRPVTVLISHGNGYDRLFNMRPARVMLGEGSRVYTVERKDPFSWNQR